MTKKRFIKLLMSNGYSRNIALNAVKDVKEYYSTFATMYVVGLVKNIGGKINKNDILDLPLFFKYWICKGVNLKC